MRIYFCNAKRKKSEVSTSQFLYVKKKIDKIKYNEILKEK